MPILLKDLQDLLKPLEEHRKEILNTKNPEEVYADPVMMQLFNDYDESVMNCTYLIDSYDQLHRRKIVFSSFKKEFINSRRLQSQLANIQIIRESSDSSQGNQQKGYDHQNELNNQFQSGPQPVQNYNNSINHNNFTTQNFNDGNQSFHNQIAGNQFYQTPHQQLHEQTQMNNYEGGVGQYECNKIEISF